MSNKFKVLNLGHFLESIDVAPWFVGMSPYQAQAVHNLPDQLRDDFEQSSLYRMESTLKKIGIFPPMPKKQLRFLITLSRGNDLAFVYFLKESFYKSEKPGSYTLNERLLLTTIYHLDVEMTIRELDRILPQGVITHRKSSQMSRDQSTKCRPTVTLPLPPKRPCKTFPYFQKQPRPNNVRKSHIIKRPNHIVEFSFWKEDKNPHYNIVNENRWFAFYQLNPGMRIVTEVIRVALDTFFKGIDGEEKISNLCDYHKLRAKEVQLEKDELIVKAKERCLKIVDANLKERTLRQDRIREQLQNNIDRYSNEYSNITMKQIVPVQIIKNAKCDICNMFPKIPGPDVQQPKLLSGDHCLAHVHEPRNSGIKKLSGAILTIEDSPLNNVECEKFVEIENDTKENQVEIGKIEEPNKDKKKKKLKGKDKKGKKGKKGNGSKGEKRQKGGKDCLIDIETLEDANNAMSRKVKTKIFRNKFFRAPTTKNQTCAFDFQKIFNTKKAKDIDLSTLIDLNLIKALNQRSELTLAASDGVSEVTHCDSASNETTPDAISNTSSSLSLKINKANVIKAVLKCAKAIWRHNERSKRISMERIERDHAEIENTLPPKVLQFKQGEVFDPDNKQQMDDLLKSGMDELRKDPRFVLASLPESHKLFILREWIKRRYGKVYKTEEIAQSFTDSIDIFKTVQLMQDNVPHVDKMGIPEGTISYNHRNKMMKLGKLITNKYHMQLNHALALQLTSCWSAMGPFMCRQGPPTETFYAYMPTERETFRFHPWENDDYRDYAKMRSFRYKLN